MKQRRRLWRVARRRSFDRNLMVWPDVLKLAPQHAWTADIVMHEPVNVEVTALWGWGSYRASGR
jgi:hypothetical protein